MLQARPGWRALIQQARTYIFGNGHKESTVLGRSSTGGTVRPVHRHVTDAVERSAALHTMLVLE